MDDILAIVEKRRRELLRQEALRNVLSLISRKEENPEKRMKIINSPSLDDHLMAYHQRDYSAARARQVGSSVQSVIVDQHGTSADDPSVPPFDTAFDTIDNDTDRCK